MEQQVYIYDRRSVLNSFRNGTLAATYPVDAAVDYLKKRTPARAALMIAAVWLMSALVCIPPLLGWRVTRPPEQFPQCKVSNRERPPEQFPQCKVSYRERPPEQFSQCEVSSAVSYRETEYTTCF
ncbi:unnamed protein product, partial [Iphiclides podalirius]